MVSNVYRAPPLIRYLSLTEIARHVNMHIAPSLLELYFTL
jgi:hypothetical protein